MKERLWEMRSNIKINNNRDQFIRDANGRVPVTRPLAFGISHVAGVL
jgi:hypothetical protein